MRLIELRSERLDGECIALSLKVRESLSREPGYELELRSPDADLDLDGLLGEAVAMDIDLGEGAVRTFHAHVMAGEDTGQMDEHYTYRLELGSWLSFLAEGSDCRIFQALSVPEIVEQVFETSGHRDYRFELERGYEPREYCVQFRESDLQFVKRLLEHEGIYFWVEHEAERHVVVMSDTQRFEEMAEPYAEMRFLPDGEEQRAIAGREGVQRLQRSRRVRPTNVALRDFDYHVPSNTLDSDAQVDAAARVALEHYDYAAGYRDQERGERLARLRLEALQAESHLLSGRANARGLTVGRAFTLAGHPDEARNRRYVVVGSELGFLQDGPDSSASGRNVGVKFSALTDEQAFRPLLRTARPVLPGVQSATVVGPTGAEVHTDKLGRIRVHFHWDRYKSTEEDASCWIRVSQAWAGKGWGVVALPRVGQEVLVTYVDGDLDRPLATGIVYNGDNPTPYELPRHSRYTGIVSRSWRLGGYQNASQLTFDDQLGAERVMIHAERDKQKTVERNDSESVGQDKGSWVKATDTSVVLFAVGFTGISLSFTGNDVKFKGTEVAAAGVSVGFTGTSSSFTGISTGFTGSSSGFTGASTGMTGQSTSFTGTSVSFTGSSYSVKGHSTSVTGTSENMTDLSISRTGVKYSETGQSTSLTGVSLSFTGQSASVTGSKASMTGDSLSITGSSTSATGTSMSTTGSSLSTTGSSIGTTGSSLGTTGSSVGTTGLSIKTTGLSNSVKGVSFSYIGAKWSEVGIDLKKAGQQVKS